MGARYVVWPVFNAPSRCTGGTYRPPSPPVYTIDNCSSFAVTTSGTHTTKSSQLLALAIAGRENLFARQRANQYNFANQHTHTHSIWYITIPHPGMVPVAHPAGTRSCPMPSSSFHRVHSRFFALFRSLALSLPLPVAPDHRHPTGQQHRV